MKLKDLEGKSREEQSQLIEKHPRALLLYMLEEPEKMQGKILVFRGNYGGFATNGLCVRTIEYLEEEDKWKIVNMDLSKMDEAVALDCHFTAYQLRNIFDGFCISDAFVMDK